MSFKHSIPIAVLMLALLLGGTGATADQAGLYIMVSAGKLDRHNTVVTFPFKRSSGVYRLVDENHQSIPLQTDGTNAWFVLRELKAGQTKTYHLAPKQAAKESSTSGVAIRRVRNLLEITVRGQKVFTFVAEPAGVPSSDIKPIFSRGGYIHPVFTPAGQVVTDDYPSDHYHHHGIWFAWTRTEFEGKHPDFWNVGDGTGRVDFVKLGQTWSGPVQAGFTSFQNYVALTGAAPKIALNEEWDVRVYDVGSDEHYFVFDIIATQQCATSSPLILEEYRYGGMGVRGHRDWQDKSKVNFLTSEGKDREHGNATRARWCHIGGTVNGQLAGLAVLEHPSNFRAPTTLRIHPDDPYFNYAPSQLGQFQIEPGKKFVMRYRYVVSDGPPDPKLLDRLWNDYADPPKTDTGAM